MAKTFVPNGKTRIGDARCLLDGFGVFVECDKIPLRPQPLQDQPGMPPSPEGGIHPGTGRLRARIAQQGIDCLMQQNRGVLKRWGHRGLRKKNP